MQGRYAHTRANGALRPPRRPCAAARAGALCFGVCARLPKSVADEQVCLFAVVDLRSSGSEPRSSTQFKARGAMAITSRAARNTMTAVETTPAVVGPGAYLSTERPEVIHGYAPFGSTAERGQGGAASQSKAPMPGPGAYQDMYRTAKKSDPQWRIGTSQRDQETRISQRT